MGKLTINFSPFTVSVYKGIPFSAATASIFLISCSYILLLPIHPAGHISHLGVAVLPPGITYFAFQNVASSLLQSCSEGELDDVDVAQHVEASPESHEVDAQSIVDEPGLSWPVYVPPVQVFIASCVVIEEHFAFVEPVVAQHVGASCGSHI